MQENNNKNHIEGLTCSCEHCIEKEILVKKGESVISAYKFDIIKIVLSTLLIVFAFISKNFLDIIHLIIQYIITKSYSFCNKFV